MKTIRVVHYLNQFFGQLGGEDTANVPPKVVEGPVGFGATLAGLSEDRVKVVRTVICGDNFAAENLEELQKQVLEWVGSAAPDLFLAGPAFGAGRYGTACGVLCSAVQKKLGIPAWVDLWGPDVNHDWPWWRRQMPYFLEKLGI